MGGSPRGKNKPAPSFEDGAVRDETIVERQEATYNRGQFIGLLKKAAAPARKD